MSVTMLNTIRFLSLVCLALVMAASLAHVFALPHKMALSGEEYLVVQQIYRGWSLFGIPAFLGLALTGLLALMVRQQHTPFRLTMIAQACIALSLAVFFLFTLPVNRKTLNWTVLPEQWEALRQTWEYSHATVALLFCTAFVLLVLSVLAGRNYSSQASFFR